jgi:hypothetical protein
VLKIMDTVLSAIGTRLQRFINSLQTTVSFPIVISVELNTLKTSIQFSLPYFQKCYAELSDVWYNLVFFTGLMASTSFNTAGDDQLIVPRLLLVH